MLCQVHFGEFAGWQAELVVQVRESLDKVSANGGVELDFVEALVQAINRPTTGSPVSRHSRVSYRR